MARKIRSFFILLQLFVFATVLPAQSLPYSELEQGVLVERLRQFSGPDWVRAATLKRLFQNSGCTGENLQEQMVENADAPNVICTLPGATDQVIIVGAHFDYVPKGDGVADNWSGASLLASLYQSLSVAPRHHTFIFIGFTDEEEGFIGSQAYVERLTPEKLQRIRAMINLDTLGLGPLQVWVSDSDPRLVGAISGLAGAMQLPLGGMNVDGIGDSDGRSFKKLGIPIITLHSVTPDNVKILHTNRDNLSAIKLQEYYNSYRLILRYLVNLDGALANDPPPANR